MVRRSGVGRCVLGASWVMLAAWSSASIAVADDTQPRFDYLLNCAGCHRVDASGSATVPPLTGLAPLVATPDGRAYLVRVPGVAQAPLSDERLAVLLNWALAEFSGAHGFAPYSAGEVATLRGDPLRDPLSERERLKRGQAPFPH